jgi:hypothetical protein
MKRRASEDLEGASLSKRARVETSTFGAGAGADVSSSDFATPTPSVGAGAGASASVASQTAGDSESNFEAKYLRDLDTDILSKLSQARVAAENALAAATDEDKGKVADDAIGYWMSLVDAQDLDTMTKHYYGQNTFRRFIDAASADSAVAGPSRAFPLSTALNWIHELTDETYWHGDNVIAGLVEVAVNYADEALLEEVHSLAEEGANGWSGMQEQSFEGEFWNALVDAIASEDAKSSAATTGAGTDAQAALEAKRAVWAKMKQDYTEPAGEEESGDEGDQQGEGSDDDEELAEEPEEAT